MSAEDIHTVAVWITAAAFGAGIFIVLGMIKAIRKRIQRRKGWDDYFATEEFPADFTEHHYGPTHPDDKQ